MKIYDEYFDLSKVIESINRDIAKRQKELDVLGAENELIHASGMSKMDKEYILVHNQDAIRVLNGENRSLQTKRDIILHRTDFLETLLCHKCGGRGKRILDLDCEKCNGTGLECGEEL